MPLPSTDARVLRLVEKQTRPFVLSTDMHLTQGGVELPEVRWDEKSLTLSGVATRAPGMRGKVLVYVPAGYAPAAGKAPAGVFTVPLQFKLARCAWAVRFVKSETKKKANPSAR